MTRSPATLLARRLAPVALVAAAALVGGGVTRGATPSPSVPNGIVAPPTISGTVSYSSTVRWKPGVIETDQFDTSVRFELSKPDETKDMWVYRAADGTVNWSVSGARLDADCVVEGATKFPVSPYAKLYVAKTTTGTSPRNVMYFGDGRISPKQTADVQVKCSDQPAEIHPYDIGFTWWPIEVGKYYTVPFGAPLTGTYKKEVGGVGGVTTTMRVTWRLNGGPWSEQEEPLAPLVPPHSERRVRPKAQEVRVSTDGVVLFPLVADQPVKATGSGTATLSVVGSGATKAMRATVIGSAHFQILKGQSTVGIRVPLNATGLKLVHQLHVVHAYCVVNPDPSSMRVIFITSTPITLTG